MNTDPPYGTIRHVRRFLFFPRKLNGKWKWLMFHVFTEVYTKDAYVVANNYTNEIEGFVDGWI